MSSKIVLTVSLMLSLGAAAWILEGREDEGQDREVHMTSLGHDEAPGDLRTETPQAPVPTQPFVEKGPPPTTPTPEEGLLANLDLTDLQRQEALVILEGMTSARRALFGRLLRGALSAEEARALQQEIVDAAATAQARMMELLDADQVARFQKATAQSPFIMLAAAPGAAWTKSP